MALLDVSEIFSDPNLMSTIVVERRPSYVNDSGLLTQGASEYYTIQACVTPASGEVLATLPEAERAGGALQVFTMFRLMSASEGGGGDEFQWDGFTYRVTTRAAFFNYGAGFCSCTAVRKELLSNAQF